jgi:hypothetical protein
MSAIAWSTCTGQSQLKGEENHWRVEKRIKKNLSSGPNWFRRKTMSRAEKKLSFGVNTRNWESTFRAKRCSACAYIEHTEHTSASVVNLPNPKRMDECARSSSTLSALKTYCRNVKPFSVSFDARNSEQHEKNVHFHPCSAPSRRIIVLQKFEFHSEYRVCTNTCKPSSMSNFRIKPSKPR